MTTEKNPRWGLTTAAARAESNFDKQPAARKSLPAAGPDPVADQYDVSEIFTLRSMFRRPQYLDISAWIEHVPFALWIMEALRPGCLVELGTHYGVSYFAFCQAVEQLSLGTRCYAVDTWTGDEHSGLYDDSVYERVNDYNVQRYSGFSQLIRAPFDDTLNYFPDGSVDLLHIDGLHTLEAVRHDFESWLPKLSNKGIVLLHDTNVRERGFGVHTLFKELREKYPVFEFAHGHGLGIVAVGTEIPDVVKRLFAIEQNPDEKSAICEAFSRLGEACSLAREAKFGATVVNDLDSKSKEQTDRLKEQTDRLEELQFLISTKDDEVVDFKRQVSSLLEDKKRLAESAAFQRSDCEKLRKRNEIQTRELAALTKRLIQSENLLEAVHASSSWKITLPLRSVMRLMRKS